MDLLTRPRKHIALWLFCLWGIWGFLSHSANVQSCSTKDANDTKTGIDVRESVGEAHGDCVERFEGRDWDKGLGGASG